MKSRKYCVNIHPIFLVIALSFLWLYHEASGQEQGSILQDRDGNNYNIKLMPDNKIWMTDNLTIKIPGSFCYENAEQNCNQYGRLYTWESAQEGCKLLGEGWRLPTNEEWQQMAKHYGGVRDDSDDGGKTAYKALIKGGSAEFNVIFGGGRHFNDSTFARLEAHGFYWTATESDTANAWFYNLGKGGAILNRHKDGEKHGAISVRCISDTRDLKGK